MASGRVVLTVEAGAAAGTVFDCPAHDSLLFGRHSHCGLRVVGDPLVSRHHFLLEMNPPAVRVRDLESLNGTWVNGVRYGGKAPPSPGVKTAASSMVDLCDGDLVVVGGTQLRVRLQAAPVCAVCGAPAEPAPLLDPMLEPLDVAPSVEPIPLCAACRAEQTDDFAVPQREARCDLCRCPLPVGDGETLCPACRGRTQAWRGDTLMLLRRRSERGDDPLADYEIGRKLGEGGMGTVYLARRKADGVTTALKVVSSKVRASRQARAAFQREIEVLRELRHPHIVGLLMHGAVGDVFYFVMEFCNGGDLADLAARRGGRLPWSAARPLLEACLAGLEYAHSRRIVHRDLKPKNLLLDDDGRGGSTVRIADFGLAKQMDLAGFSGMTSTGMAGGTPYFMPREQLTHFKQVRPTGDVWSLAATFYFLLTGTTPLDFSKSKNPIAVLLESDPTPISSRLPELPPAIAALFDRALRMNPLERFPDAGAFRAALVAATGA